MYYGDFSCSAAALESGKRAGLYPYYCDEYFYIEYDFTICGKYDLSYGKFNRKGKPQTPQAGPCLLYTSIVATAIYTFINAWNEFLYSLILINDTEKMTVAVALRSLDGAEILDWGDMMAASALVVIPSIIFFCLIQNKIAGGLSEGAVK